MSDALKDLSEKVRYHCEANDNHCEDFKEMYKTFLAERMKTEKFKEVQMRNIIGGTIGAITFAGLLSFLAK